MPEAYYTRKLLSELSRLDRRAARFVLHTLLNSLVSVRVEGQERIPKQGGALLVCNHTDIVDPLIQELYSGRELHFLAKAELFDAAPLRERITELRVEFDRLERSDEASGDARFDGGAGWPEGWPQGPAELLGLAERALDFLERYIRDARVLPIVRGYRGGDARSSLDYYAEILERVQELLQNGEAAAIYPEGERSLDGRRLRFRGFAARAALRSRAPLIPCAILGARGFSDLNRWVTGRKRPRSLIYRIGEPLDPSDYPSEESKASVKELTRRLEAAVDRLLEEGRPGRRRRG